MNSIVIIVENGEVKEVRANNKDTKITLIDCDILEMQSITKPQMEVIKETARIGHENILLEVK